MGYQTNLIYWLANVIGNVGLAVVGIGYLISFFPALKNPFAFALAQICVIWLFAYANMIGPKLVGLVVEDGEAPLVTGAHGVETRDGAKRSIGYVTSSYVSPGLGRPIALGLIERGASRHGEVIDIQHQRTVRQARIAAPCAFDPAGERLNG